jgi:integrase
LKKYFSKNRIEHPNASVNTNGLYILVQRLLGHANLQMATGYVQDVSAQTDRVIENSRKYMTQAKN